MNRWWWLAVAVVGAYTFVFALCRAASRAHEATEEAFARFDDDEDGWTPEEIAERRIAKFNGGVR